MAQPPRPTHAAITSARELRRRITPHERTLWNELRDRRLAGLKFRRQQPIGPYVADFVCKDVRLIVELDGTHHDQQLEYDQGRTEYLESYGFRVLRFRNQTVTDDLDSELRCIADTASRSRGRAERVPE